MFKKNNQILYPGSVIDNNDPMMMGRIRAVPLNEERDKIVKAICRTCFDDIPLLLRWTSVDPFLCIPFIPFFIQQVPKNDEYVHILHYDRDEKFKNQFYVQGPFTSPMNSKLETSISVSNYMLSGKINVTNVPLKNDQGQLTDPLYTKGIFIEPGDNAILGRGSADVVLKENDVLIRAGKYESEYLNSKELPKLNNKRSFLQISNFKQKKVDLDKETVFSIQTVASVVKYLIEWNIYNPDNLFDSYTGIITLLGMRPDKKVLSENLKIDTSVNDISTLIYSVSFVAKTYDGVVNLINDFIKGFDTGIINIPNNDVFKSPSDRYPFAFRPNIMSYRYSYDENPNNSLQRETIQKITEGVKIQGDNKIGLVIVYNLNSTNPISKPKVTEYVPSIYDSTNLGVNILGSENIFLLSHNSQIPGKNKINLNGTLYGIGIEKINEMLENTNSVVRGEELLELLNLIVKFMIAHVHPFHGIPPVPVATDGTSVPEITKRLLDAPNNILNQNIRIN